MQRQRQCKTNDFDSEEAASNRCSSHIDGGILKQVKWMKIHNSQCKDKDNEKSMIWMVYKSFPMRRGSLQPLFGSQRGSEIDILRQVKWMYIVYTYFKMQRQRQCKTNDFDSFQVPSNENSTSKRNLICIS